MRPRVHFVFLVQQHPPDTMKDPVGFEDDVMTKPFDLEELKLRIQNAIQWAKRNDSASG